MITMFLSFSIMSITIVNGNTRTPTIPNSPSNDIKEEPHQPIDKDPLYPIEEGTLYLTIYNDSVDPENNFENKILAQETIPLTSFQEGFVYEMPNAQKEDGFIFMDWVIYSGNKNPSFLVEDGLDEQEISLIKPDENGDRKIDIHAAWRYDGTSTWPLMLTLEANTGFIENQSSIIYDAVGPLFSGSTIYLCAYPIPIRNGYDFLGWYDTPELSGESIKTLNAISFCDETDEGVDWSAKHPVTLYAKWQKAS